MAMLKKAFYSVGFWIRETGQAMDRRGCRLQGHYGFQEQLSRHRTSMNVFDKVPSVTKEAFVALNAALIGDVKVGQGSSIWYGCVLRGDVNCISVGSGINIQDNTLVHVAKAKVGNDSLPTLIGNNVTIAKSGMIKSADKAADIQNFIICLEMAVAAVGHLFAFPYKEYAESNIGMFNDLSGSLSHVIKVNDFYHDTVHQFAPTYHDYVLYSNGGEEGTRRYRARTFVPAGLEMDALQKSKQTGTNTEVVATSSSISSSIDLKNTDVDTEARATKNPESMKSSLLLDPRNDFSQGYDVSPLEFVNNTALQKGISGSK